MELSSSFWKLNTPPIPHRKGVQPPNSPPSRAGARPEIRTLRPPLAPQTPSPSAAAAAGRPVTGSSAIATRLISFRNSRTLFSPTPPPRTTPSRRRRKIKLNRRKNNRKFEAFPAHLRRKFPPEKPPGVDFITEEISCRLTLPRSHRNVIYFPKSFRVINEK